MSDLKDMGTEAMIEAIREKLSGPLPGAKAHQSLFPRIVPMPPEIPENARESAVLAVLFFKDAELNLLFMERTEDSGAHSRQISFPGGRKDATDIDLRATALRELKEEVGIDRASIDVLGALTPLYIPVSNFRVFPFVGFLKDPPAYLLSKDEVAGILEVPVAHLMNPESRIITKVVSPAAPDVQREVNAYQLPGGEILWGATAMMVAELIVLLKG